MKPWFVAAYASALGAHAGGTIFEAPRVLELLGQSAALGAILAAVAYASGRALEPHGSHADAAAAHETSLRSLHGASNLLFLCVGLTGTMILVNHNLVRAFAISAAVALVRFRVKLDSKSANATLLFGVLAGVACGLEETQLAWILVVVHIVLAGLLVAIVRVHARLRGTTSGSLDQGATGAIARGDGGAAPLRPSSLEARVASRGRMSHARPAISRAAAASPHRRPRTQELPAHAHSGDRISSAHRS